MTMADEYNIPFNDRNISFTLKRTNRRSIGVKVFPDKRVEVTAPIFSSHRFIMKTVKSKASWIIKKQDEFNRLPKPLPASEYKSGDIFKLTGIPLILNVIEGKSEVFTGKDCIYLSVTAGSTTEKRKKLLLEWYRKESRRVFAERIPECLKRTASVGITEAPQWDCKKMRRRWGSCSAENKIYLNIELVSAPVELIDYVIIHELCHFIEHNHSPQYYALLSKVCPDWKDLRKMLNESVGMQLI